MYEMFIRLFVENEIPTNERMNEHSCTALSPTSKNEINMYVWMVMVSQSKREWKLEWAHKMYLLDWMGIIMHM